MAALETRYGRDALVRALRAEAAVLRARESEARTGDAVIATIEAAVTQRLTRDATPSLRRVINATGVILHTNLGRAPLGADAAARVAALAAGYTNLEYDLEAGTRGRRDTHAERDLCSLTGAEAAVVVNNNAAATLIVLTAIAAGREVIISRGELVEIGGGFRVPDVLAQSGAILREVGTTNRTRAVDFEAPLASERARAVLRVHPSNFTMSGFVESPDPFDVAELAHRYGAIVIDDLGSGALLDTSAYGLTHEPLPTERLAAGSDVVTFSGDKLVGGPQAGLIVGRADLIARMRRDPLARAMRPDKVTMAGVALTLGLYRAGRATTDIPVWRMIAAPLDGLRVRAEALWARLGDAIDVVDVRSTVGGGSLPGETLPSVALAISARSADRVAAALRHAEPPVIGRIEDGRIILDLRTVDPAQDGELAASVDRALAAVR